MADTIYMRRHNDRLVPITDFDRDRLMEIPAGTEIEVSYKRRRSPRQHRFFWALLSKVTENHPDYKRPEQLLLWLKVRLGYVEEIRFPDGQMWPVVKSTSFASMGADQFREFMNHCLDLISSEVLTEIGTRELLAEVEQMLGFTLSSLREERETDV